MQRLIMWLKKAAVLASVTGLVAFSGALTGLQPSASAATGCDNDANMLGLPVWYRGLCSGDKIDLKDKTIGAVVVIIALNAIDIILRLLSVVAVGFIIYGGFLYMTSRGEPSSVARGKAALTQAIVGLIIGIASSAIVGFIVGRMSE